jgi:glycosyltransferase involved in cell wall biosynthesis
VFSVVLIVRDEERRLAAALASLGDVPEVLVCDTGSRDRTLAIASSNSARIVTFDWCDDFAAARQFAESQATYDWIVRFDADERLAVADAGQATKWLTTSIATAAAQGADRLFVRRRYAPHNLHWFPRCHRRTAFRWRHPVHELLEPIPPRVGLDMALDGAVVEHDRENRPRHYRSILEQALVQNPADPHLLYYAGAQCFEERDLNAAERWLSIFLQGPTGYRYHGSEALSMRGRCRAARGDLAGAHRDFEDAAATGPRAEPLLFAARLALASGDYQHAGALARRGRAMPMPCERQPFGDYDHPYLLDRSAYEPRVWDEVLRVSADAS